MKADKRKNTMLQNQVGIYLSNQLFTNDLKQYIETFSIQYQASIVHSSKDLLTGCSTGPFLSYLITDPATFNEEYLLVRKIREKKPDFKLVMLYKDLNTIDIPGFIQSGVDLFLSYQDRFQEILASMQQSEQTGCFISPRLMPRFVDYIKGGVLQPELETLLSKRELEMLYQIIRGETAKEAAEHLSVSVHTINFHLKKIYHKLGIKNKAQLISRFKDQLFVRR